MSLAGAALGLEACLAGVALSDAVVPVPREGPPAVAAAAPPRPLPARRFSRGSSPMPPAVPTPAALTPEAALPAPLELVPEDDPLAQLAHIRGDRWPLVWHSARSPIFPPQEGLASYYWQGQRTATGDRFDAQAMTAAHRTLPLGTIVRCTRLDTGASVVVVINDRGPFVQGRIIDLSLAAARALQMLEEGLVRCRVEVLAYPLIEPLGPRGRR